MNAKEFLESKGILFLGNISDLWLDRVVGLLEEYHQSKESVNLYAVDEILSKASKYGLLTDVMVSSLQSMQNNPTQSVEEVLNDGLNEWVK